MTAFETGVKMALLMRAAQPVEGQTKTEAGVTKVYRQGRWVNPTKPPDLSTVVRSRKLPGYTS